MKTPLDVLSSITSQVRDTYSLLRGEPRSYNVPPHKLKSLRIISLTLIVLSALIQIFHLLEDTRAVLVVGYPVAVAVFIVSLIKNDVVRVVVAKIGLFLICVLFCIVFWLGYNNGYTIFWLLLTPPVFMYYYTVYTGMIASLLMWIVFTIVGFSGLQAHLLNFYSMAFLFRFPLVYMCDIVVTFAAMMSHLRNKRYWVNQDVELEDEVKKERKRISDISMQTIMATWNAMSAKDPAVAEHCDRVSKLCVKMAEVLGYDEEQTESFRVKGLLHDIGKIGISDELLALPKPRSEEDEKEYRRHVEIGIDIVSHMGLINDMDAGIRYHHERFDGSGYPEGLKGEQIPFEAALIGIADECDDLYTYYSVMPENMENEAKIIKLVIDDLEKMRNIQFEDRVVDVMERALNGQTVF